MFSTEEFAWKDIQVVLGGRPIPELTMLEYDESQNKELIHASGYEPVTIGRGQKLYSFKLGMLFSGHRSLVQSAGGGKILGLKNLDIIVNYSIDIGGQIITDVLKGAEFTTNPFKSNRGETHIEYELEGIFLSLAQNV